MIIDDVWARLTRANGTTVYSAWTSGYEPLHQPGGAGYGLLNLRALKLLILYKINMFQCMGKIFCVEFHTKYHTNTLKDVDFIHKWKFKSCSHI